MKHVAVRHSYSSWDEKWALYYIKYKTKVAGSSWECVYERIYDIYRYRAEVLISPEISDFPGPTLLFSRSRSLFYYPSTPPTLHRRRRHRHHLLRASPLYQTKQSRTHSDDDNPYVRLLGDNLYTQVTYVITYSLDTSFSRARRFHGFVPPRLVIARGLHCATIRNSMRVYSLENVIESSNLRYYLF